MLCKMDLSSAFRLIPIHPSDFCLLGIFLDGNYYFDKCMPLGCSIACATFEHFFTFIHWLVSKRATNSNIIHYLDDFLFGGVPDSAECAKLSEIFQITCEDSGVPINSSKTEGPTTKLSFLGLGIDTINQTIFIPPDKCDELQQTLYSLFPRKKVTLKELQCLCGSLNFFAKALPGIRAFNRRFYNATLGVKKSHHFIKVTHGMKEDMRVWLHFLQNYNGYTPFPSQIWFTNESLNLFTDSCGSCGGGAFFDNHWAVLK